MKEINNKSENKDPRILKEIEQHISLLEEGLEKSHEKLNSSGNPLEQEVAAKNAADQTETGKPKVRVSAEELQRAQPSAIQNEQEVQQIEAKREKEINEAHRPNIKLDFLKSKELVNSDNPISAKEQHDEIKEKYDRLQDLVNCLWA